MVGLVSYARDRLRTWLGVADRVGAQRREEASGEEEGIDSDNAKAIADLAYRRYSEELSKGKDIEARASPVLSLLSAAIIFGTSALGSGGACLMGWERSVFYVGLVVGMALLVLAELNLFLVLTTQGTSFIDLADWATSDYTRRTAAELRDTYEELAGSYLRYTEENIPLTQVKLRRFNRAITMVLFGIVIIVTEFMWAGCGLPRLW